MTVSPWRICFCIIFLPLIAEAQPPAVPVLTVCDLLRDLSGWNGKTVIVVGRFSYSDEGSWIGGECPTKVTIDEYSFSNLISTTIFLGETAPPPALPKGFRWDGVPLRGKLEEVKQTTTLRVIPKYHYSDEWVAVYGRLEAQTSREIYGVRYLGYGHLSAAPAQIVWPKDGWYRFH